MELRFLPYTLELKHAFGVAGNTRTSTPAMLVEVERDGIVGYGEAAMPPYLAETQATATAFLSRAQAVLARSIRGRRR
jgi:L-Ala-D/L-Glu epimerase